MRFDRHRLDQMRADLGAERCERIIDRYLDTATRLPSKLSRHLAAHDISALGSTAHKLASAASLIGLNALAGRAKQLLATCRTGTWTQLNRETAQLRQYIRRSGESLSDYREALRDDTGADRAGTPGGDAADSVAPS